LERGSRNDARRLSKSQTAGARNHDAADGSAGREGVSERRGSCENLRGRRRRVHRFPVRSKTETRGRARAGRGRRRRNFGLESFAGRIDCEREVTFGGNEEPFYGLS